MVEKIEELYSDAKITPEGSDWMHKQQQIELTRIYIQHQLESV